MKLSKTIILGLAAGYALSASAQGAPRSAYFLEGYSYRHELNPAFMGERNYVSIPALANIDLSLFSNVGVNNFIFKNPEFGVGSSYRLTTFMSSNIDAGDFLGKLKNNNHINGDFDITLLSAGFRAFGGFNTISIGAHADMGVNIPKDFFKFMKLGQDADVTTYNFKDIKLNATALGEIAFGHSRVLTEDLTVGAKLKFLLGIGNVNGHITDMDVRLSNDQWHIKAAGEVRMSAGSGLYVPTKHESGKEPSGSKEADLIDWNNINYDRFGLAGFGLGLDLGVTYRLLPDLQLSAAINDFGFVNWSHATTGLTGKDEWVFNGFQDVAVMDKQNDYDNLKLSEQLDHQWEQIQEVINIHRDKSEGSYARMLNATIRLGAEYNTPFYKPLSAGFLFSSHIAGCQSWTEGRFYANVKPTGWFGATINYGASTYGSSFGWMLNFHPKGFNFFIGSDHQFFTLTPQMVPVGKATASVNVGFNVTFGS